MANQNLAGKTVTIPDSLYNDIRSKNVSFFTGKQTSYENLKRVKNGIESGSKSTGDSNLDKKVLDYINGTLNSMRNNVEGSKQTNKNLFNMNNEFIKTHQKDRNSNPTRINTVGEEFIFSLVDLFNQIINEQASNVAQKVRSPQRGNIPTLNDIITAIDNKQRVWIDYQPDGKEERHDIKGGYRLIEPYVIGQGLRPVPRRFKPKAPNDKYYLRAFVAYTVVIGGRRKQTININNVSLSEEEPHWRMFRLDKIKSWYPIDSLYIQPRDLYNPADKDVVKIIKAATF